MSKSLGSLLTAFALTVGLEAQAPGQDAPPAYTAIVVETMHCASCAKRIGGQLGEVQGVAKVQYSVEKKTLWVHPHNGRQLSPRALWEAVEKADDRPLVLQGPSGTFRQKPQS